MKTAKSKLRIYRKRWPSSPARRAAALASLQEVKASIARIEEGGRNWGRWVEPLLAAARFCADVNGDEPSMSQLRAAVEDAEAQRAAADEYYDLRKLRGKLASEANYYRWQAIDPVGFCAVVVAEGDTRSEVEEKIREYK